MSILTAIGTTLTLAAPATAKELGQVAPKSTPSGDTCGSCVAFQRRTAPGSPSYKVPEGRWTISAWRTRNTTPNPVHARLYVFKPAKKGHNFRLVAQSHQETIPPNSAPTFSTHIHASKGELLGLDPIGDMATYYGSPAAGDVGIGVYCHPHPGDVVGPAAGCGTTDPFPHDLVNIAATAHRRH